jgi:hypothetical protein
MAHPRESIIQGLNEAVEYQQAEDRRPKNQADYKTGDGI